MMYFCFVSQAGDIPTEYILVVGPTSFSFISAAAVRTMKTQCAVMLFAACLIAVTARSAYQLPYGVELLQRQIVNTFSCAGRPYGYYADVDNDCEIFHVCMPVRDDQGNVSVPAPAEKNQSDDGNDNISTRNNNTNTN